LDDGDLLLPLYGGKPGGVDAVAAVIRSADDGMTWSPDSETMLASAPGVNFVEPALGYLGGGRLLAMIRTEGAEARRIRKLFTRRRAHVVGGDEDRGDRTGV